MIDEQPEYNDNSQEPELAKTCMVTVRMTEEERDKLNRLSRNGRIPLNDFCRHRLGLPANTTPRTKRRGNPKWLKMTQ